MRHARRHFSCSQIAVDNDPDSRPTPNVCRSEGRWRLEGAPLQPKLVFWRETADCEGNGGWTVVIDGD